MQSSWIKLNEQYAVAPQSVRQDESQSLVCGTVVEKNVSRETQGSWGPRWVRDGVRVRFSEPMLPLFSGWVEATSRRDLFTPDEIKQMSVTEVILPSKSIIRTWADQQKRQQMIDKKTASATASAKQRADEFVPDLEAFRDLMKKAGLDSTLSSDGRSLFFREPGAVLSQGWVTLRRDNYDPRPFGFALSVTLNFHTFDRLLRAAISS